MCTFHCKVSPKGQKHWKARVAECVQVFFLSPSLSPLWHVGGKKNPPPVLFFSFFFYSVSSGGMRRHARFAEPPLVPAKPLNNTCSKLDSCFGNLKWLTEPPDVLQSRGRCERGMRACCVHLEAFCMTSVQSVVRDNRGPTSLTCAASMRRLRRAPS